MFPFCKNVLCSINRMHLCFPKIGVASSNHPSAPCRFPIRIRGAGRDSGEIRLESQGIQRFYTPLHGSPVCNAIAFSHTGESWWIVFRIITVARVLHNYCTRLGRSSPQMPPGHRTQATLPYGLRPEPPQREYPFVSTSSSSAFSKTKLIALAKSSQAVWAPGR